MLNGTAKLPAEEDSAAESPHFRRITQASQRPYFAAWLMVIEVRFDIVQPQCFPASSTKSAAPPAPRQVAEAAFD
jgi:hypothetical protein